MAKPQLVEARCPKCTKTTPVMKWKDGTIQEAHCPPSTKHRRSVIMKPGAAQVTTRLARA